MKMDEEDETLSSKLAATEKHRRGATLRTLIPVVFKLNPQKI